jgi:hypothetical protein
MTLTYRGIAYQASHITVPTQNSQLNATYRGQSYQIKESLRFSKPAQNLTYRGVKYSQQLSPNLKLAFN